MFPLVRRLPSSCDDEFIRTAFDTKTSQSALKLDRSSLPSHSQRTEDILRYQTSLLLWWIQNWTVYDLWVDHTLKRHKTNTILAWASTWATCTISSSFLPGEIGVPVHWCRKHNVVMAMVHLSLREWTVGNTETSKQPHPDRAMSNVKSHRLTARETISNWNLLRRSTTLSSQCCTELGVWSSSNGVTWETKRHAPSYVLDVPLLTTMSATRI